jgi:hypothetical protein
VAACHQWTEGLLDYYHYTGDERALEAAIGIVKNEIKMLEDQVFPNPRYGAPRQMGWALRALVAVFNETHDPAWTVPCEKIVRRFMQWQAEFGSWISPYTARAQVRVPFMQGVAIRALGFYEQVKPDERIRKMVISEVDDILNNCLSYDGKFFYKELPHLQMGGVTGYLFECFVMAYRYSGDIAYLTRTRDLFKDYMDEYIRENRGPRNFAQAFPGPAAYLKALEDTGL